MSDREGILLCTEDERIRAAFHDADVAPQGVDALERDEYHVVVLDAHSEPETVAYLAGLSGARRRDITVVLVCEDVTTGDRDRAWRESVDLVVATDDLENIESTLQEGVSDKGRFYERFRNIANTQGQS